MPCANARSPPIPEGMPCSETPLGGVVGGIRRRVEEAGETRRIQPSVYQCAAAMPMGEGIELHVAKSEWGEPEGSPHAAGTALAVTATVLAAATAMLVATVEALMVELALCPVEIIPVEVLKVVVRLTIAAMIGVAAMVAIPGIEIMIHRAIVAWAAVIPGACTDKHAAIEPLGAIVPIRSAVIGGKAIVAIRADRSRAANVYTKRNLAAGRR